VVERIESNDRRYNNKMAYKVVNSVDCCTNLSLKLNITLNTMRIRAIILYFSASVSCALFCSMALSTLGPHTTQIQTQIQIPGRAGQGRGGSGRAGIMAVINLAKKTAYRSADVDCAEMVS